MDFVTISIGGLISLFGVYTMVMRTRFPDKSTTLTTMKAKYGAVNGTAVHIFAYSVVPIVLGIILSFTGLYGMSLWGVFKH